GRSCYLVDSRQSPVGSPLHPASCILATNLKRKQMPVNAQAIAFPGSTMPQLNGYLARPAGDGPFPALVVIHEAFGLNDDIRSIARHFAEEGYIALAVDLFSGRNQ